MPQSWVDYITSEEAAHYGRYRDEVEVAKWYLMQKNCRAGCRIAVLTADETVEVWKFGYPGRHAIIPCWFKEQTISNQKEIDQLPYLGQLEEECVMLIT